MGKLLESTQLDAAAEASHPGEQRGEACPLSRQKAGLSASPQRGTRAPGPRHRGAEPQKHRDADSPGNPLPEGICDGARVPRLAPTMEGSSFREMALSSGGSEHMSHRSQTEQLVIVRLQATLLVARAFPQDRVALPVLC